MTPTEFRNSKYYRAIISSPLKLTEWVYYTEEEKKADEVKKHIGGYLKIRTFKEAASIWWENMTEENREIIKQIPNFSKEKFKEITGIDLGDEE